MQMDELLSVNRIVPVVVIDNVNDAVPLAETLKASGIGVIEITLRSAAALESIENIAREVPGMIVGAGSIRRSPQLAQVRDAGAHFAVSSGATESLVVEALGLKMPFIPGAATPSEMLLLLEQGFTLQKLFPAEAIGGINFLKSVASPIPEVRFMPTGGISAARATDYLCLPNVVAIGGSWITPSSLVRAGDFDQIGRLAEQAAQQSI